MQMQTIVYVMHNIEGCHHNHVDPYVGLLLS